MLKSLHHLTHSLVTATDGDIGKVKAAFFDDQWWTIRYLVIDTRKWWPGGKKVLIACHCIDRIDWATNTVHVKLTRDQVKNSLQFEKELPVVRDYEERLHASNHRTGSWDS